MSETKIEWASHTWNPYLWRCNKVSAGCKNCYMFTMAERYGQVPMLLKDEVMPTRWPKAEAELKRFPSGAVVFVNSMSDTFHEKASMVDIQRVFRTAATRPDLTFLVLTKRIERAYNLRNLLSWPKNLWLGTSVESDDYMSRLDWLLKTPAFGKFLSAEPLLGPLPRLPEYLARGLGWVIAGGESGVGRRPFKLDWVRGIRDACQTESIPFMYKQGAAFKSGQDRVLDGRTWDGVPMFESL